MGEYAELQLMRDMRRPFRPKVGPVERNPIARTCPICGKGTRGLGADMNAGLRSHMKAKHRASLWPRGGVA